MEIRRLDASGLPKPGETGRLTDTGPGWTRQESPALDFGRVWNSTNQCLRTKPVPLARYPDPLLTLHRAPERQQEPGWYPIQKTSIWDRLRMACGTTSVSNRSGPSLRVRVWVKAELFPNWRSGLSTHLNCQFGYGSMEISQPVWIGRVVSGSPSGSICRFI
jgi:hypothetical protein